VTDETPPLSLGEGFTPLVHLRHLGGKLELPNLYAKIEGQNPTGSFKDRGMVLAVAKALEAGARGVICASTGNTSASAAAYGAAAGLEVVVVLPKGQIAAGKLLQALVQEELGLSEERMPNPLMSALSSSVATFFGAMIPVLPFFFLGGLTAVIVAAFVSLVAHFAVGASKTLVTGRNPFVSGGEMTIVGAVEGVVTYLIGILISPVTA